jgi:predicted nucleic acid-binding protein
VAHSDGIRQNSTHPRIFASPLTPGEALKNVTELLRLPNVRAISEREGFLDAYAKVCDNLVVRGNFVPDAHLATILIQHGIKTLYSSDRDFRKFEILDLRDPFV